MKIVEWLLSPSLDVQLAWILFFSQASSLLRLRSVHQNQMVQNAPYLDHFVIGPILKTNPPITCFEIKSFIQLLLLSAHDTLMGVYQATTVMVRDTLPKTGFCQVSRSVSFYHSNTPSTTCTYIRDGARFLFSERNHTLSQKMWSIILRLLFLTLIDCAFSRHTWSFRSVVEAQPMEITMFVITCACLMAFISLAFFTFL